MKIEVAANSLAVEPVIYDFEAQGLSEQAADDTAYWLFVRGRASFDDELQDAVAINKGVDSEGRLDMDMLAAAQSAETYLVGRRGQPVVLAELIHDEDGNIKRVDALLGVLADSDKLIGTFDTGGFRAGGIALQGQCHELDGYKMYENFTLNRSIPISSGHTEGEPVMPLHRPSVTLGKLEEKDQEPTWTYTQELIAGDDILPWLRERFGEGLDGYEMFIGLLNGIRDAQAQAYILQEPFASKLQAEIDAFTRMSHILADGDTEARQYERALDGSLAKTAIKLTQAADDLYPNRVPFSRDSSGDRMTADITSRHQIAGRKRTADETLNYLGGLIVR